MLLDIKIFNIFSIYIITSNNRGLIQKNTKDEKFTAQLISRKHGNLSDSAMIRRQHAIYLMKTCLKILTGQSSVKSYLRIKRFACANPTPDTPRPRKKQGEKKSSRWPPVDIVLNIRHASC